MRFMVKTWGELRGMNGVAHITCPECKREEWKSALYMASQLGNYTPMKEGGYFCVLCGCKTGFMRPYIAVFRE